MPFRLEIPMLLALAFGWTGTGFGQLAEMTSQLPPGPNAITAIDAASLLKTPLAKSQGWSSKLEAAYVQRAMFLPPEADKLLIGSQVLVGEDLHENWEAAVMTLTEPLSMRAVARAEGGYVDEINGKEVVWSPSGAYLIGLNDKTLGIFSPAQRQSVGRWIDSIASNPGDNVSPYLQQAIAKVTPSTQVVMAIDLKNTVSPHRAADRLKSSETVQKSSLKLDDFIVLVESIEGATIEVSVGEQLKAKSRVDFSKPVQLTDAIAKRLVLETLDRMGAVIDDLEKHKYTVVGQSIIIEGELSNDGLRRLFSVLEIPTTKFSELKDETKPTGETDQDEASTPSPGDVGKNSQVYFKSVTTLLDDLRRDRDKQDTRGGSDGVWMERYARKIDRLPILYVDDELLDWGSKTAETLRIMASNRRNAGLTAGSQKSALRTTSGYSGSYYNYTYGYGGAGYGGSNATATEKDRNQIERQVQNQATATKVEGWRLIEDATADIRRTMTQKYNVEF